MDDGAAPLCRSVSGRDMQVSRGRRRKGNLSFAARNTAHCQRAPAATKAETSECDQPFGHSEQQRICIFKKEKENDDFMC